MVAQVMRGFKFDVSPFHSSHLIKLSGHGAKCALCGARTGAQLRAPCSVEKEVLDSGEDRYCRDDGDHYDGYGVHLAR
jgi:hypothetical protein